MVGFTVVVEVVEPTQYGPNVHVDVEVEITVVVELELVIVVVEVVEVVAAVPKTSFISCAIESFFPRLPKPSRDSMVASKE